MNAIVSSIENKKPERDSSSNEKATGNLVLRIAEQHKAITVDLRVRLCQQFCRGGF